MFNTGIKQIRFSSANTTDLTILWFGQVWSIIRASSKYAFLLIAALLLSACSTFEYKEVIDVPISQFSDEQDASIDDELILDVGVVLFDHGIDRLDDNAIAYANVRKSEAVWFTSQLKATLDKSNAWGLVRSMPAQASGMDLLVQGKLVESHGERVQLEISAEDSTGRVWLDKTYEQQASQYSYNPEVNLPGDPFQSLFNRIANDLFDIRASLTSAQLREVRATTKVLFARDFAPDAFDEYVETQEDGTVQLLRVPAEDDPMMRKVSRIQARNDLFLDVIQDYYRTFNNTMEQPYQEWRKLSYKEVLQERQLREQARKEKIASVVAIAGGVVAANSGKNSATRIAGIGSTIVGANFFARSFLKTTEAQGHSDMLRELGRSLELELEPSVVDLQDRSVTLSGTVQDQFKEWRRILSRMFELSEGELDVRMNDDSSVTSDVQE